MEFHTNKRPLQQLWFQFIPLLLLILHLFSISCPISHFYFHFQTSHPNSHPSLSLPYCCLVASLSFSSHHPLQIYHNRHNLLYRYNHNHPHITSPSHTRSVVNTGSIKMQETDQEQIDRYLNEWHCNNSKQTCQLTLWRWEPFKIMNMTLEK